MTVTPHGHGSGFPEIPVPTEKALQVLAYMVLGAVYAGSGYVKKREQGKRDYGSPVQFSWKRFGRTVLIGTAAGAIVAIQGERFSGATVEAAMVIAIPFVDQLWNGARAHIERVDNLEHSTRDRDS